MKTTALLAAAFGLMCSAAYADGTAMQNSNMAAPAMSNSGAMSNQGAMTHKPAPKKKHKKTGNMMGGSMSGPGTTGAMNGSGDAMTPPAKPH